MPRRARPRIAICYDFDGTLAPGNMHEHDFIPNIGLSKNAFWTEVKARAKQHDMDEILAYMQLMLEKADASRVKVTRKAIRDYGKTLKFFPGVEEWFPRITAFGTDQSASIEHIVISSGLREMIDGTSIKKYLMRVFASGFYYDQNSVARWPAVAVNYTTKTQYLFRVNKGISNSWDNTTINKYTPESDRPIPFKNMIYLGDGETDIPAMKMVNYQGGRSIAVYPPNKKKAKDGAAKLVTQGRAGCAHRAHYGEGKPLDVAVKSAIEEIAARCRFERA